MTMQTQILRPTVDTLGTVIQDLVALGRGDAAYLDGPRAVVVPLDEAISRLAGCLDLLPRALLDPSGPTEWELDFAAHEIREAALIWAAPSRYVELARTLETLAHTIAERRTEATRTFAELPPAWQELSQHLKHCPDFKDFKPSQETYRHA